MSISVISSFNGRQTDFSPENVLIEGDVIAKVINARHSIFGGNVQAESMNAIDSRMIGEIHTNGDLTIERSEVFAEIRVRGAFEGTACKELGVVRVVGNGRFMRCDAVDSMNVGALELFSTNVAQDVTARKVKKIKDSIIRGTLTFGLEPNENVFLERANVKTMIVDCSSGPGKLTLNNCKVDLVEFKGGKGILTLMEGSSVKEVRNEFLEPHIQVSEPPLSLSQSRLVAPNEQDDIVNEALRRYYQQRASGNWLDPSLL